MASNVKHLKDQDFNEPMVVFHLKQHENLMGYVEDIEDRLSILERQNEPTVSQEEVDENFRNKFGKE